MMGLVSYDAFFLKQFIQILKQEMIPLEIIDVNGICHSTGCKPAARHQIRIKDKKFFKALASPDAFHLGEAYVNGYFDIKGNINELYELFFKKLLKTDHKKNLIRRIIEPFLSPESVEKKNISHHYDVPSRFYRQFLGRTMGYTCGYYSAMDTSTDDAQEMKMDIICRKLRLEKNDRLLDIGCGWGNFAVYAAKHYDAQVIGITLSREQKAYADQWVNVENLSEKVQIKRLNYRQLKGQTFDKISCIGMSEHVGRKNMAGFYNIVHQALKKGGLFMQHTITTHKKYKKGYVNPFMDKYMFPGGQLMSEHELIGLAGTSGFELLSAENFRPHYVRTLNDWINRMESARGQLLEIIPENVFRIYHIFFIGSMIAFKQKQLALFQNLFHKPHEELSQTDLFSTPYAAHELSAS